MTRTRAGAATLLLALVAAGGAVPAHAAAPSQVTLVLSSTTSSFGEVVTASAQVTTAGPADGDVAAVSFGVAAADEATADGLAVCCATGSSSPNRLEKKTPISSAMTPRATNPTIGSTELRPRNPALSRN